MAAKPLDWDVYLNQPVRIYRNLGNGKMSIQAKTAVGWRVVGHVTDCVIHNVSFTVKEPARQRVIRDKQKNVHAWGEGVLIGHLNPTAPTPLRLSYNPYKDLTQVSSQRRRKMNQSKGIEPKVHYPDDYQQDLPLQEWLTEEWDDLSDTPHPVFVIYESRENCIVPPNHLLIRNQVLSDGRLLRCDWRAPVTEGDQGSYFIRVEKIGSASIR